MIDTPGGPSGAYPLETRGLSHYALSGRIEQERAAARDRDSARSRFGDAQHSDGAQGAVHAVPRALDRAVSSSPWDELLCRGSVLRLERRYRPVLLDEILDQSLSRQVQLERRLQRLGVIDQLPVE